MHTRQTQGQTPGRARGRALAPLAAAALLLAGAHAGRAQTLSLTPSATTAAAGATVTFTLNLTGGQGLAGYNTTINIDPGYLQFVNFNGGTPFLATPVFPFQLFVSPASAGTSALTVSYSEPLGSSATVSNPGALGTFEVSVLKALPAAGTTLSFSGSEVDDANANNVLQGATPYTLKPAAAPEPAQGAALGIGALGLAAMAVRARRTGLTR